MLWPLRSPEPAPAEPAHGEAQRLHAALDALTDAVILLDSDGQLLDVNAAAARLCGRSEAALREDASAFFAAIEPADALWLRRALAMACQGQNRRGRFARFGPPASPPVEVRVEPLREHPGGAVAVLTLRPLHAAAPTPDPAKRLGLHAVDLAVELEGMAAKLRAADPEQLRDMGQTLDRMQRELARLGRRAVGEVPDTARPEELVEGLVRVVRHALPSTLRLRSRVAPAPTQVRCDPESLHELGRQVARLAMASSAREVGIEAMLRGSVWSLTLAHDGSPMPLGLIERLSRPALDDEARPFDIAAWRAKARYWGGELEVLGQPGVGMRFSLRLPVLRAVPAAPRHPERPTPRKVLVLESEHDPREHMQAVLREAGAEVAVAADAVGALDAIEREAGLELVLLGVDLPAPGSRHMLRLLRRLRPDVPVLMVGGYTNVPMVRECIANGALAFLPRRFSLNELRRALETEPA